MRREGLAREVEWYKGRWWDQLTYGMLDRDWRASRIEGPRERGGMP